MGGEPNPGELPAVVPAEPLWCPMLSATQLAKFKKQAKLKDRYAKQLHRVKTSGAPTKCIEAAVTDAMANLATAKKSALVIYGEPQSGKTEMMICLTAKLLDEGHRVIIHLLNDSVQLLQQNLDRFQRSNLSPSAKNFSEVIDPDYSLKS